MVEITTVTSSIIELSGIGFSDGEKVQKIMDICHKYKHLYKDGYYFGRKTRKKRGTKTAKWADCPEVSFTYLVTDDTNDSQDPRLRIHVLISDTNGIHDRYTDNEIEYFRNMYVQEVADEILSTIH